VEFSLPQSMASPTSGDSCCRVDVLEKVLNLKVKTHHSVGDPIEDVLISYYVTDSHSGEKEEYARLLNESTAYTPRQSPKEVLSVEEPASKEQQKCPSKVELKPLSFHLRYEFFFTPLINSLLLLMPNWMGPSWKNYWMCFGSIGVPLAIVLMILQELALYYACIASFLMKAIDRPDNLNVA